METVKERSVTNKKARKIILIALSVLFLIYVIINIVFWNKGVPERFFKYEITENGSVEINYCSAPFFLINIPDTIDDKPVTSIGRLFGDSYFDDGKCNLMKHFVLAVRMPDSVEEIHYCAFGCCNSLRIINIPASLRYTSPRVLADTKVKKLVFPEGITEIGCGYDYDLGREACYESFADMKYLQKVVFPKSLKRIGNNTFADCPRLKKVTLPDSIEEIKYGAFQNSGLKEANIPKSLVKNSGCIFKGTPFEETLEKAASDGFVIFNDVLLYKYVGNEENVVIPDGIENICDRAFWTARNVKTVGIPESVRYINSAFEYSSVENLVIPDTVDTESEMSFYFCDNLKEIVLPDKLTEISPCAFKYCASLESISIPESTRSIGSSAFEGCKSLERIIIPESVEEIGDNAFSNCNSLKEVVINGSPHMGKDVFKNTPAKKQ
ncbi:MAG: leucine-rich repeat domain-containing protein [Ruminococcus sp.]|nr:leucine-rich repeat domain-containing protein [Ruminococcus sp.]